jgi:thioredoxin reductase
MSEVGPRPGRWRLVIVGGGSGAAIQVRNGDVPPQQILVIAERLGTGMSFIGRSILQSYTEELLVSGSSEELRALLPAGELRPTAAQYDTYVRDSLLRSGASVTLARVTDIQRDADGFVVVMRMPGGERCQVRTDAVVLATGSTPRKPPIDWQAAGAITYDTVHRELENRGAHRWAGRSVLVVGGGNSAMQTASLMATDARDVTILANRYVGMYPAESDDRFAWRVPSQLTYEIVVKSSRECGRRRWRVPCIRHLVYDSLDLTDDEVCWRYSQADNLELLGSHSLPGRCHHAQGRPDGDGVWREIRKRDATVVVWATGSTPVYTPGELLTSLLRTADGTPTCDEDGQTNVPGLYLTGACAGHRSVNETVPARTGRPVPALAAVRSETAVARVSA